MLAINLIDGCIYVIDLDTSPKGGVGINGEAIVYGPLYEGSLQDRLEKAKEFILKED